jgi:hypothetical protein
LSDSNHHSLAVDVTDGELTPFGNTQPGAIR